MQKNDRLKIAALDIPLKANRILNCVLIGMVLILLRVWHLAVIQHDQRLEEARKPQVRTVISPAKRGTIRDRFNIPLAINKVQYNASVLYSQIRQIPSVVWEKKDGKRFRVYKRREYITNLSKMIEQELGIDAQRIEDLIHSKASFYNSLPLVIKEDISEEEYYRLKMMERDWLGIHTQLVPKRYYPMGKVGGDIIGYMGAISSQEYETVIGEIRNLETMIEQWELGEEIELPPEILTLDEVKRRLSDLIEHAYSINDYVGKTGVEGSYEEELRGFHGKKSYFSDARGNYLRELSGSRMPLSGRRVLLTISSELQEFAEKLLIQNDEIRKPRLSRVEADVREILEEKEPWIKGGAIIAMEPQTGELIAMASHPRFDPNDFISSGNIELKRKKNANIKRWFESEGYIGDIWDQKRPLEREIFNLKSKEIQDEGQFLTWERYLKFVLPAESSVRDALEKVRTIKNAVELQQAIEKLMQITEQSNVYSLMNFLFSGTNHIAYGKKLEGRVKDEWFTEIAQAKKTLDPILGPIVRNFDKVLVLDLCRIAVEHDQFNQNLLQSVGNQTISSYNNASSALRIIEELLQGMAKDMFHELTFVPWRVENQKAFLKEMRIQEKIAGKKYAAPYIDLLDAKENELFREFWSAHRMEFVEAFLIGNQSSLELSLAPYYEHYLSWHAELEKGAHQSVSWRPQYDTLQKSIAGLSSGKLKEYLATMRHYDQLNRLLFGKYPRLRTSPEGQTEKHLAAAFYPVCGFGYGRSYAFRQATTQGSIFKLVTSYAALMQRYYELGGNELTFNSLNPLEITDDYFKLGSKTYVGYDSHGSPLPQKYKGGLLPRSPRKGFGKLDLLRAIELSSNPYFSVIAGDYLESPDTLLQAARGFSYGNRTGVDLPAEFSGRLPQDLETNKNGLYAIAIGQHSMVVTPLQTAVMISAIANGGKILRPKIVRFVAGEMPKRSEIAFGDIVMPIPTEVVREVEFPPKVREMLLEGMHRVIENIHTTSLRALSTIYQSYPDAIKDFKNVRNDLVGKSGTAESVEFTDLDSEHGTNMYNHVWFSGILFNKESPSETFVFKDRFGEPELVVIVFMRYGNWGKDLAPVASQVAQKWRDIKKTAQFRESL